MIVDLYDAIGAKLFHEATESLTDLNPNKYFIKMSVSGFQTYNMINIYNRS